jgi:hypothetical protein
MRYMGVGTYTQNIAAVNTTRADHAMFYAANGQPEKALETLTNGGDIRQKVFIHDFLYSTFENLAAGTIGFGVIMLLNPASISMSYLQLLESAAVGTFIASTARSLLY